MYIDWSIYGFVIIIQQEKIKPQNLMLNKQSGSFFNLYISKGKFPWLISHSAVVIEIGGKTCMT